MGPESFVLGVIGHPLGHTRSPRLHRAALAAAGLEGVYLALPTHPDDLKTAIAAFRAWRWRGLNVTLPHKVTVVSLLDGLTSEARTVGAVNTIFWEGDRLIGDNTDVRGFDLLTADLELAAKTAVVLGVGGAARAVATSLGRRRLAQVTLLARREKPARELVEVMSAHYPGTVWRSASLDAPLEGADLLVNATPVGMAPQLEASPVTESQLRGLAPEAAVVDLIYEPSVTPLMLMARGHGLAARSGGVMLAGQAQAAFERWTGLEVPIEVWLHAMQSGPHAEGSGPQRV